MLTAAGSTDEAHEHRRPPEGNISRPVHPRALDPSEVIQRGLDRVLAADDLKLRAQRQRHGLSIAQLHGVPQRLVRAAHSGGVASAVAWPGRAGFIVHTAVLAQQVVGDALAAADVLEVASEVEEPPCDCTCSMSPRLLRPAADDCFEEMAGEDHYCWQRQQMVAQQRLPSATHWDGKNSQLQEDIVSHGFRARSTAEHSMQAARPQGQSRAAARLCGKGNSCGDAAAHADTANNTGAGPRGGGHASPAGALRICALRPGQPPPAACRLPFQQDHDLIPYSNHGQVCDSGSAWRS